MGRNSNILTYGSKNLDPENWEVYHPNGTHMFTCSGNKANWYLKRDLAEVIDDDKIILKFIPNGEGYLKNEIFGKSPRKIQCVVDGSNNRLQRHHIVPYCYRSYFPIEYKSKNHHDVVLISEDNHIEYEKHANVFKDKVAQMYGIKTITEYNRAYTRLVKDFNTINIKVLGKLKALFYGYNDIPQNNIIDNLKFVSKHTEIDYDFLINCNYIQLYKLYLRLYEIYDRDLKIFRNKHAKYYDHGYHLMKKMKNDDDIEKFIKMWRKHFIDTMNPQYMPKGWSVDFRCKNL